MTLNDLFAALATEELSNLQLAEGGVIAEHKKAAVLAYIEDGLLRLHTRFPLVEKDVLIEMQEGVTHYHLLQRYAYSQYDPSNGIVPYIVDSADPFLEDVIKVTRVYNSYGVELPLNDEEAPCSVFTPQPRVLLVPRPVVGSALDVVYRARHPKLSLAEPDQEIYLPDFLEPVLKQYVAYKAYNVINTQEAMAIAAIRMQQFDSMCQEAVEQDTIGATTSTSNTKFSKRGWC